VAAAADQAAISKALVGGGKRKGGKRKKRDEKPGPHLYYAVPQPELAAVARIDERIEAIEEESVSLRSLPSIKRARGRLRLLEQEVEELTSRRILLLLLLASAEDVF
jgi:hypothetical protein